MEVVVQHTGGDSMIVIVGIKAKTEQFLDDMQLKLADHQNKANATAQDADRIFSEVRGAMTKVDQENSAKVEATQRMFLEVKAKMEALQSSLHGTGKEAMVACNNAQPVFNTVEAQHEELHRKLETAYE